MAPVLEELAWGEAFEAPILQRWLKLTDHAPSDAVALKSGPFSPFDAYLVEKDSGFIICYVEIKKRRKPLAAFGDVICPWSKHEQAVKARAHHDISFLLVTEYACGALVEVDLAKKPSRSQNIKRRDRPGTKAVKHAVYEGEKLVQLQDRVLAA